MISRDDLLRLSAHDVNAYREQGMAEKKEKFYITTPIYYTNGMPHIGHIGCV